MLVASMNPCPCGYYNHPEKECVCPPGAVKRYLNKISGPLLDRIDIHMEIVPVPFEDLSNKPLGESSETIRKRVIDARKIQENRYKNEDGIYCNAQMNSKLLRKYAVLDEASKNLIQNAMKKLNLSARAYDRILKLARTIADLDHKENIEIQHISEAISYRNLDKEGWAG
jgi:magnesium chelatase family protein